MKVIELYEGIVYCYTNTTNDKKYIGETIHENKRKYQHLYHATISKRTRNSAFYNAIRKYGYDKFIYEVLFRFDSIDKELVKSTIRAKEIEVILEFDTFNNGYNLNSGGGSGSNKGCMSILGRANVSKAQRERKHKPCSQETKDKIGEANRGHKMPKHVMETLITYHEKEIIQYDKGHNIIKEWKSLTEACKNLGLHKASVSRVCLNKQKTSGGFIWKYKTKTQ